MGRFRKSRRRGGTITHKEIAEKEERLTEVEQLLAHLKSKMATTKEEREAKAKYEQEIEELNEWLNSYDYTDVEQMPKGFNPELDKKHQDNDEARKKHRQEIRKFLDRKLLESGLESEPPAQTPVTALPENNAPRKSRLNRFGEWLRQPRSGYRDGGGGKRTRRRRKTKRSGGRKRKSRAKRRRTRR